ncbi:MAG TPA: DUF2490 domain-containing protein [Pyrinomonadaceae bacterium]|nr:DUF2490 domain-containing protein [Pyrinomonadaceae bacterium]
MLCRAVVVSAQQSSETRDELWPEIDIYIPINDKYRLLFTASGSRARETRENFEVQLGAHLDYFFNERVSFRVGYRHGFSPAEDDPFSEHRIVTEQSIRKKFRRSILLTDRNRQDWRWVNGDFSFRYRNRLTAEKEFRIRERPITPYGSAEIFYDTRFSTFNRYRFAAGVQIALRRIRSREPLLLILRQERVLDIYYLRQEDTRSDPKHVNAIGISFSIHF